MSDEQDVAESVDEEMLGTDAVTSDEVGAFDDAPDRPVGLPFADADVTDESFAERRPRGAGAVEDDPDLPLRLVEPEILVDTDLLEQHRRRRRSRRAGLTTAQHGHGRESGRRAAASALMRSSRGQQAALDRGGEADAVAGVAEQLAARPPADVPASGGRRPTPTAAARGRSSRPCAAPTTDDLAVDPQRRPTVAVAVEHLGAVRARGTTSGRSSPSSSGRARAARPSSALARPTTSRSSGSSQPDCRRRRPTRRRPRRRRSACVAAVAVAAQPPAQVVRRHRPERAQEHGARALLVPPPASRPPRPAGQRRVGRPPLVLAVDPRACRLAAHDRAVEAEQQQHSRVRRRRAPHTTCRRPCATALVSAGTSCADAPRVRRARAGAARRARRGTRRCSHASPSAVTPLDSSSLTVRFHSGPTSPVVHAACASRGDVRRHHPQRAAHRVVADHRVVGVQRVRHRGDRRVGHPRRGRQVHGDRIAGVQGDERVGDRRDVVGLRRRARAGGAGPGGRGARRR